MAPSQAAAPALRLPVLVFGMVEVRRLKRELEALEEFLNQTAIREPGKQAPLPRMSRLLEGLAADNGLQLLQAAQRQQLKQFLLDIERSAPNIHISFAADPSAAFTARLVTWLRSSIHPYVLLEVGLQPTITAGCVVRTTNKVFDFSLRERLGNARALLMNALEAAAAAAQPLATPAVQTSPVPASAAADAVLTAAAATPPSPSVTVQTPAPAIPVSSAAVEPAVAPVSPPAATAEPATATAASAIAPAEAAV